MIKNLIFDLGEVIVDQKPVFINAYLSRIFSQPLDLCTRFYAIHNRDLVTGQITSLEMLQKFKEMTGDARDPQVLLKEFEHAYHVDFQRVNTELLSFIDQLAKKYDIYIFSNTIDAHNQIMLDHHIYDHVKRVFKSYVEHIHKPERESYEYVAKQIGARTDECVFIDNLQINVDGAIQTGMKGVLFTDLPQLRADLALLGVKI